MPSDGRSEGAYGDLFNPKFAQTEIASKNGSLDFGDLKSGFSGYGSGSNKGAQSPSGILSENDSHRQTSPRSPVGRTDKKKELINFEL